MTTFKNDLKCNLCGGVGLSYVEANLMLFYVS